MNSECSKDFSPVACYEGRAWKKRKLFVHYERKFYSNIYVMETPQEYSRYKRLKEFGMFWSFMLSLPQHDMVLFKTRNSNFLGEIL